jgi:modulator of FtsH protease HflC
MKAFVTFIVVLIIAGFLFFASAFIVKETEQVVVLQFGEVVRLVDKPGLSFLIPFVQDAKRFDKRWLEWDGDANQITTRDKRYIYIDVFARWRIKEPLIFIETLRDEISALGRLDDIIDNATRNVVANHRLIEAIRSSNRKFESDVDELNAVSQKDDAPADKAADDAATPDENDTDTASSDENTSPPQDEAPKEHANDEQSLSEDAETYAIEEGRNRLTRLVLEKASAKAAELGIEIKDVQIKRINYIENVEAKVFDRMISERKRVAEAYRSEGQGRSAEILGKMEMELQQIQSEAYRESQKIMGRADAKAAEIYAEAYNKNPDFYQFTKTMESYRQTVNDSYTLVLSTDGDYLGHLQAMEGKSSGK